MVVLLPIGMGQGAVTVSLPTEGHYRPGRYLPVRIEGATSTDSIKLLGNGTVPTEIDHPQSTNFTVPWLIASDSIPDARWQLADGQSHPVKLRALAADERLVGFAGTAPESLEFLFPNNTIVPVRLEESRPLLEPAEAWECLDGVVLSASAAARVDEAHRSALLAGGTIIAVRSDAQPDDHWPWKLEGGYWILRYAPAGPQSIVEPAAYGPTYGWERGWPESFRRRVVFAAVLFCILSLATLLWRSRWAVPAFVAISLVFALIFATWYGRQSPMLLLESGVRVDSGPISQLDLWMWQSTVRATDSSFPCVGLTHPYLGTLKQIEQTNLRLICRPDGRPESFTSRLEPAQSLAFLSRRVQQGLPPANLGPATPDSLRFASDLYITPGDRIEGQYSASFGAEAEPIAITVIRAARGHRN